jgi:hypothetical protein
MRLLRTIADLAAKLCAGILIVAGLMQTAAAEDVPFAPDLATAGWEMVQFGLLRRASFKPSGDGLVVRTDGNGALIWRPLDESLAQATRASWTWSADQAVPSTDLTVKGGDDRVLSVYFLFGTDADVGKSATRLLRSDTARAVVYTFGGNVKRGTVQPSPHMGRRGSFIVLRGVASANGAAMAERVNFAADYRKLFGSAPQRLLGVAISSDSDDTGAVNSARISGLMVEP